MYTPYLSTTPAIHSALQSEASPSSRAENMAEMRMLRLYSLEDLKSCPLDRWGILDPGEWRRDVDYDVKRDDGKACFLVPPPV